MKIRFLGHSAFELTGADGTKILIDPFLEGNPQAAIKPDEASTDYVVVTHAHGDHLGDTLKIAQRCGSLVICVSELAAILTRQGCRTQGLKIGEGFEFPFGSVKLTPATHGSTTPNGTEAGPATGALIRADGLCIYHMGDTGLFKEIREIGEANAIDWLLIPIGGHYTMDSDDAVKVVEMLRPRCAIPMHYNTWPVIKADPQKFCAKLQALGVKCLVLKPGESV
ncbi:MAG TPA: metal-dependent hydrolase [Candidatus Syntrophosphaera sp.]|nr:metal-dependent hydrolase [Candidatus Syntrophosphaera sp.]